ncbi:hypothetical protein HUG17_2125 [Dermatophagoides farinae]|uniref:Uncharacterized protein n=1 Tax=Dermatophagoides farinae TaxID=6954 RepID=A0A9D4P9W8_DERFA|nr:hypothetical protein HUG17_2125 [Dermatophagoides farinae]
MLNSSSSYQYIWCRYELSNDWSINQYNGQDNLHINNNNNNNQSLLFNQIEKRKKVNDKMMNNGQRTCFEGDRYLIVNENHISTIIYRCEIRQQQRQQMNSSHYIVHHRKTFKLYVDQFPIVHSSSKRESEQSEPPTRQMEDEENAPDFSKLLYYELQEIRKCLTEMYELQANFLTQIVSLLDSFVEMSLEQKRTWESINQIFLDICDSEKKKSKEIGKMSFGQKLESINPTLIKMLLPQKRKSEPIYPTFGEIFLPHKRTWELINQTLNEMSLAQKRSLEPMNRVFWDMVDLKNKKFKKTGESTLVPASTHLTPRTKDGYKEPESETHEKPIFSPFHVSDKCLLMIREISRKIGHQQQKHHYCHRAPRCKPYATVEYAQCSQIELKIRYPTNQYGYNHTIDHWGTINCNDNDIIGYQLWLIGYGIVKKFRSNERIILNDLIPGKRYCFNGWAYNSCGRGPVFTLEGVCAVNNNDCLIRSDEHCELDVDYSW